MSMAIHNIRHAIHCIASSFNPMSLTWLVLCNHMVTWHNTDYNQCSFYSAMTEDWCEGWVWFGCAQWLFLSARNFQLCTYTEMGNSCQLTPGPITIRLSHYYNWWFCMGFFPPEDYYHCCEYHDGAFADKGDTCVCIILRALTLNKSIHSFLLSLVWPLDFSGDWGKKEIVATLHYNYLLAYLRTFITTSKTVDTKVK